MPKMAYTFASCRTALPLLLFIALYSQMCIINHTEAWRPIKSELEQDLFTLLAAKSQLHDPDGHLSSWSASTLPMACTSWNGILCNSGRVISLNLNNMNLSGNIPSVLSSLTALETLDLSANNLTGSPSFSSPSLKYLLLYSNRFSGSLPPLYNFLCQQLPILQVLRIGDNPLISGDLHVFKTVPLQPSTCQLQVLGLASCNLTGSIPAAELALAFPNLSILRLDGNSLSGGIPSEFAELTSLSLLQLDNNRLSGQIPSELASMTNLTSLSLNNNNLSGQIPPQLAKLHLLSDLSLRENHLSGAIPPELGSLASLTVLDLSANNLSGIIPSSIGNLSHLTYLVLNNNSLTGSVPNTISNLSSLVYLFASNNLLSGEIPQELGLCYSLQQIALDANQLTGSIPPQLGNLANLTDLLLFNNSLTGPIPPALANSTKLSVIALNGNKLTGPIPPQFGQLSRLKYLYLYYNHLSGPIPPELARCAALEELDIFSNQLSGTIPPVFGQLQALRWLHLRQNNLSGVIPPSLGYCRSLAMLDLASNELTGSIPSTLGMLNHLNILMLYENKLTSVIPSEFENCKNLQRINLYNNRLSGPIPTGLCSNGNLLLLDLTNNSLEGQIPKELGKNRGIFRLRLGLNQLSGSIPPELGSISSLGLLDLSHNNLTGEIPPQLSQCSLLMQLFLDHNQLSGQIPPALQYLNVLTRIDLSYNGGIYGNIPEGMSKLTKLELLKLCGNRLSGPIPSELGSLTELATLDLQNNALNGEIPSTIGNLTNLIELRLSQNNLSGPIPPELGHLSSLQVVLDLSFNHLSGEIPPSFENLRVLQGLNLSNNEFTGDFANIIASLPSLITLNVSNNMFNGLIPEPLSRFPSSSFAGNTGLCGIPLSGQECLMETNTEGETLTSSQFAGIMVSGLLLLMAFILLGTTLLIKRRKRKLVSSPLIVEEHSFRPTNSKCGFNWTFNEIMEATGELSDSNIIGSGGFGTIYKAVMRSGQILAVKKACIADEESIYDKSFMREVQTLGKVRHRHLVKLIGFCSHKGLNLLIYEFMPNGSLWDRLHGQTSTRLSWEDRFRIAVGIAEGIAYLHHDCIPKIIHRDIKSSNILLDSEGEAHVGDFGLAKHVDTSRTTQSASMIFAGSYGYIAPEYAYSMKATEKSDVYSFGVVLMELVSGKLPVDSSFPDGMDMVTWVRSTLAPTNENIKTIIDPRIGKLTEAERLEVLLVLRLALECTSTQQSERPSMREAADKLDQAKRQSRCLSSDDSLSSWALLDRGSLF